MGAFTVAVALTNTCNLRCRMCGAQWVDGIKPKMMKPETWNALLEKTPEGRRFEINSLGEHTLHPQFFSFIEKAKNANKGFLIQLQTNGTWGWSDDELRNFLLLLNDTSLVREARGIPFVKTYLGFSVDGGTKESYEWIRDRSNFDTVIENIKRSLAIIRQDKLKITVGVAYIMTKTGLPEVPLLLDLIPGIGSIDLKPLIVSSKEMFKETWYDEKIAFEEMVASVVAACGKKRVRVTNPSLHNRGGGESASCKFPNWLWVDVDGNVFPCAYRYDLNIGNIVENSWAEIIKIGRKKLDLSHPACSHCFEPPNSFWSWEKHFNSKAMFDEYIKWKQSQQT